MVCLLLAYSGMQTQYSLQPAAKINVSLIGRVHLDITTLVIYNQEM